jgi:hypothetical protein
VRGIAFGKDERFRVTEKGSGKVIRGKQEV